MPTTVPTPWRRARAAQRDAGFTLIELLVVVLIIGVLAAIAIPVYVGAQSDAQDNAVKADLANSRVALQVYVAANPGTWPALSATNGAANLAALRRSGWAGARVLDASTVAGGSASSWCLKETSASSSVLYVTQSSAPTTTKPAGCL